MIPQFALRDRGEGVARRAVAVHARVPDLRRRSGGSPETRVREAEKLLARQAQVRRNLRGSCRSNDELRAGASVPTASSVSRRTPIGCESRSLYDTDRSVVVADFTGRRVLGCADPLCTAATLALMDEGMGWATISAERSCVHEGDQHQLRLACARRPPLPARNARGQRGGRAAHRHRGRRPRLAKQRPCVTARRDGCPVTGAGRRRHRRRARRGRTALPPLTGAAPARLPPLRRRPCGRLARCRLAGPEPALLAGRLPRRSTADADSPAAHAPHLAFTRGA